MTTNLVLATKNPGKVREFRALFWDVPRLRVRALDELGKMPDVIEDGKTFEENAIKKAREIALVTGTLVLADDSGLEVDALSGRPGVHSARYAGRHGDDAANNDKLLAEMAIASCWHWPIPRACSEKKCTPSTVCARASSCARGAAARVSGTTRCFVPTGLSCRSRSSHPTRKTAPAIAPWQRRRCERSWRSIWSADL
jgi:inosine/xanthosine triphosphate pyrophosphatase family protein